MQNEKLTDEGKAALEVEVVKGARAEAVWKEFVEPFYVAKTAQLFNAFRDAPQRDVDGLIGIKLQLAALDAIKGEFANFMETGKIADFTLKQAEKSANLEK